ncbi:MAG: tRNA (cytidine(34)-2'-O)-methyltransferase, partial [Bacillota bacterium]|nr:tRNA (cytidine(34)-2'-O)-methyltransferase [Bacillota bacterium]
MHVVLVEPEIPQNTGNIARTCAATGTTMHLIRPLGFSTADRYLKRAGLDYWSLVTVHYHDSFAELQKCYPDHPFFFTSVIGKQFHSDISYPPDSFLVFGKETEGLPRTLLQANAVNCIRLPMVPGARSLNLSN